LELWRALKVIDRSVDDYIDYARMKVAA